MEFLKQMANDPVPAKEARAPVTINKQPLINTPTSIQSIATPTPAQPAPQIVTPQAEPTPASNTPKADVLPKFFDEVEQDTSVEDPATSLSPKTEEGSSEDAELEAVINPGAEHFKKLRTSHREVKKTLAEKIREAEELKDKVTKYETGEIVPDLIRQKDEEIARLSSYEKLVNLKGSKEYKEKYVTPLQDTKAKLKEIFADYGVPQEELDTVINKALNAQKRPELNSFLLDHLGNDELGAAEAKSHIFKAWDIQKQAQEAEAAPAQALEALQQETEALNQHREIERQNKIVSVAKSTWLETLNEVREEGHLLELIHKDDDPEFNANYPDKLLPQAAKEYGKMVTELGKVGVKELPKPLAKAMAKMVMYAISSGVSVETRNRAIDQVSTLTQNLTRHHTQLRPPIGGGVARPTVGGKQVATTLTPEQEAFNIVNSVVSKR